MRVVAVVLGLVGIWLVAQEAVETVVVPRRIIGPFRLTGVFFLVLFSGWKVLGRYAAPGPRRDRFLSYFGPLTLLLLFAFWGALFVLGFALLLWGLAAPLKSPEPLTGFGSYLYLSGTTFFTLGLGDITIAPGPARFLLVIEVALGFSFLALVIGYVPVLYQSFSRRELRISLLDARGGSPPSAATILERNCSLDNVGGLNQMLYDWEAWAADILESHLSYPVLVFYRSQHESQSWVESLTVMLDTCALLLTGMEGISARQARFTFAMARHAAVDLAQTFGSPLAPRADRLPPAEFVRLRETLAAVGLRFRDEAGAEGTLADIRATYEPFVAALAEDLFVSLPPWVVFAPHLDDWQTSPWDDDLPPSTRQALLGVMRRGN